jgi:hypothetical protein
MSQSSPSSPLLRREMSIVEISSKPWRIDLLNPKSEPSKGDIEKNIAMGDKGDLLDVILAAKKWRFEHMDVNWIVVVSYGAGTTLRYSEKIENGEILKGRFNYYSSKKEQEDVDFMDLSVSEIDDLLSYLETMNSSEIEDLPNLLIMIIDKYAECSDDKKQEIEGKIEGALIDASSSSSNSSSASTLLELTPEQAKSSALTLSGPAPAPAQAESITMNLGSQSMLTDENKRYIVSAIVKIYNVIDNTHDIQLISNAIGLLEIIKDDISNKNGVGIDQVDAAFIHLIEEIIGFFAQLNTSIKTLQHVARNLYIKLRLFAARYDIYDLPVRLQMSINSLARGDKEEELKNNMDVCQAYVMDGGFASQLFDTYNIHPFGITVNGVATVDGISPVGDPKRTILMNSHIIKKNDGAYTSCIKYAFQGMDNKTRKQSIIRYSYMQIPKTIQIFGVVHVFADYREDVGTIVVYTVEEEYFKANINSTSAEYLNQYREELENFAETHKFDKEFFGLDGVTSNDTTYCIIGVSIGSVPVDFIGGPCAVASNSSSIYKTRCAAGELTVARISQLALNTLFIPKDISQRLHLLVLNTVKTVGDAAKPYAAQYAADFFNDEFFPHLKLPGNVESVRILSNIGFNFITDGRMKVAVFTGDGFMQTFDTKDVMIWFGMKPNLTVYGLADSSSIPIDRNNRVIEFGFEKIEKLLKIAVFGLIKTSNLDTKHPPHLPFDEGIDYNKGTPKIWKKYSELHNFALEKLDIPKLVGACLKTNNMENYRTAITHPIKQLLSVERMVGIFRQGNIEQVSDDITRKLMKTLMTTTPEMSQGYMQQYNITALVMLLDDLCREFQIDPISMSHSKKRSLRELPVKNSYWFVDWLEKRMNDVFMFQYQPYCQKELKYSLGEVIGLIDKIKKLLPSPSPLILPPPPPPSDEQNKTKRRKIYKKKRATESKSASSGLSPKQQTKKISRDRSASLSLKDSHSKQQTKKNYYRGTMSSDSKRNTKKASSSETAMSSSNPPWKFGGFIEKK